jgi:glycosyltransferase involved in cell wall biosynthesis
MIRWHILTGEYPPQSGGVSDYTRLVAAALVEAGDEVHVWAPECGGARGADFGVRVHRLPGRFGLRALARLHRALRNESRPYRLLVQYVPQMYGCKAMNLSFSVWLRYACPLRPWVMFHEVAFPISAKQSMRHDLVGRVTRLMAQLTARSAERCFVATPSWRLLLRQLAPGVDAQWLPVPSNIDNTADALAVTSIRTRYAPDPTSALIGHFGTYGSQIAAILKPSLLELLKADARRVGLLIGRNSDAFVRQMIADNPELCGRLSGTGEIPAPHVAECLKACDVLLQPYIDGATSRRGSLMAGLALGVPIVTTRGHLSEPFWENGMVAICSTSPPEIVKTTSALLTDAARRSELGRRAAAAYEEHFSLLRTIHALRNDPRGFPFTACQADNRSVSRCF